MLVDDRENENGFELGVNDHSKTIRLSPSPLGCLPW